ncbi:MAG: pyridoxal phosphate-dependent aminotransferase [Bacteroidales bacterium]
MSIISERIKNLSNSATLEMAQKSRELKEQGVDVVNLSIGEPDFNTPDCIKGAAIQAIQLNHTHYTAVPGIQELRRAIADKLKNENGLDYSPEQIVVSNGAKHSIANAILCLVNPGDEVIVPSPYWVSYPEIIKLAEGRMVDIPASIDQDFKINAKQLKKAITEKTKVFLFNSPNNPTGSVYTKDELKAFADVLCEYPNVFIISDEIYEYINYNGKHESIAQFESVKERVIVVNGVSKGYAMTGWRIGYTASSLEIAKACNKLQGQITSGAASISQYAALSAMKSVPCSSPDVRNMVETFAERRNLVLEKLKTIPGIKANEPPGAFYVFPNISYYFGKSSGDYIINTDNELCLYLLDKAHVAAVPGDAFGNPNCIRISYATSNKNLQKALRRMKEALAHLH